MDAMCCHIGLVSLESYLWNTNRFQCSHSGGECGPTPTRHEHQAVFFKVTNCPVTLSLLQEICPTFAIFPGRLLYTMENADIANF